MRREPASARFGGPTVLTVLIVLSFACLSLLALSRAGMDHRLTARGAQTVSDYYAAEGEAERIVSLLSRDCGLPAAQAGEAMAETARAQGARDVSYDGRDAVLRFTVPAGAQGDYVSALRLSPEGTGVRLTLLSARVWPRDEEQSATLPVYQN
ncbi:MAG: hypothetical protein Q4C72_08425 [Eubacteriales bacterium]|nr:hypothetical protein [Eubacteriales bacterium]